MPEPPATDDEDDGGRFGTRLPRDAPVVVVAVNTIKTHRTGSEAFKETTYHYHPGMILFPFHGSMLLSL
jgi:hypothetical protein